MVRPLFVDFGRKMDSGVSEDVEKTVGNTGEMQRPPIERERWE